MAHSGAVWVACGAVVVLRQHGDLEDEGREASVDGTVFRRYRAFQRENRYGNVQKDPALQPPGLQKVCRRPGFSPPSKGDLAEKALVTYFEGPFLL